LGSLDRDGGDVPSHSIPDRSTSRYAGQYSQSPFPDRLLEIFSDSERLALTSKNPRTAQTRFELAVEVYHQLMSLSLPSDARSALVSAMTSLADRFPSTACFNEARGHVERAEKLKTVAKQLESLRLAKSALERGLSLHDAGYEELRVLHTRVAAMISEQESARNGAASGA
jgi:hypothetical protein